MSVFTKFNHLHQRMEISLFADDVNRQILFLGNALNITLLGENDNDIIQYCI